MRAAAALLAGAAGWAGAANVRPALPTCTVAVGRRLGLASPPAAPLRQLHHSPRLGAAATRIPGAPGARRGSSVSRTLTLALEQEAASVEADEGPGAVEELLLGSTRVTRVAHRIFRAVLQPGDFAVDATCGKGNDTLLLARYVLQGGAAPSVAAASAAAPTAAAVAAESPAGAAASCSGRVLAIDVQDAALAATRELLEAHLPPAQVERVELQNGCHAEALSGLPPESAKLVVFNLGYLPGNNNKHCCTGASTTLPAVRAAMRAVCRGGVVSIMVYQGHPEGLEEQDALNELCGGLDPEQWVASGHGLLNRPTAPRLLLLYRRPVRPPKGTKAPQG